jgi:hypothetical protein
LVRSDQAARDQLRDKRGNVVVRAVEWNHVLVNQLLRDLLSGPPLLYEVPDAGADSIGGQDQPALDVEQDQSVLGDRGSNRGRWTKAFVLHARFPGSVSAMDVPPRDPWNSEEKAGARLREAMGARCARQARIASLT